MLLHQLLQLSPILCLWLCSSVLFLRCFLRPLLFHELVDVLVHPHQLLDAVYSIIMPENPSEGSPAVKALFFFLLAELRQKTLEELSDLIVLCDVGRCVSKFIFDEGLCEGFLDKEDNDLEVAKLARIVERCVLIEISHVLIRPTRNQGAHD